MSFLSQYNLAQDGIFVRKLEMACVTAAISVAAEANTMANHTKRVELANKVLLNPSGWAVLFAKGAASNVAISDSSSDSDIQFTVNSQWDAYATDTAAQG